MHARCFGTLALAGYFTDRPVVTTLAAPAATHETLPFSPLRTTRVGPAMATFIALVLTDGRLLEDYPERPAPDPAPFGLSAEDDGSRTDPLMRTIPACNAYRPDTAALSALGSRLVLAAGVESGDQMAARGARSVAAALALPVAELPSHHAGFLGNEFGEQGEPEAFAAALRELLT